ncbi:MAG: dTDP-4-dehydrorhamnose reductase [candidate division Zixibacteria bacterium RBG_16_50_21]|nr:MAG: dTDP-4-dehydrorhamnose reductase [candidate division Zixibacteria bacterium RBG_16_50_21]
MERVLITGANGLLGQKLVTHFSKWFEVLSTSKEDQSFLPLKNFQFTPLDITEFEKVNEILYDFQPELIVNAAAYTDVDGCEDNKEMAWQVNVEAVKNLSGYCQKNKIKIIHYSTDYIFDGQSGPYSEDAKPNPLSYYGQTKLLSEEIIQESQAQHLIVRSNVIFGVGTNIKNNFFIWAFNKFKAGQPFQVVDDQFNNPTLADNLALATLEAVERNLKGTLNIGGAEYLSRFDFGLKVAKIFGFDAGLVSPMKSSQLNQKAIRPIRGGLNVDLAKTLIQLPLLDVETALEFIKTYYELG